MEAYHIYCDLKEGVSDIQFADSVHAYLSNIEADKKIAGYRLTRRKLGLGPPRLQEFHIIIDFENMAQMDEAFGAVASRSEPIESFHHAVNSKVANVTFALYRDFPDNCRRRGEEKF